MEAAGSSVQRHPEETGRAEIKAFPTHLAVEEDVAASTQNQAFGAGPFLYGDVLWQEVGLRRRLKTYQGRNGCPSS